MAIMMVILSQMPSPARSWLCPTCSTALLVASMAPEPEAMRDAASRRRARFIEGELGNAP
eukprot:scaffold20031_cov65-Phaeocystis_antarctica.AAC.14